MKPVVQLERTGCGIASVAALAGVSYRQAQRVAIGSAFSPIMLWSETGSQAATEYGIRSARIEMPSLHGRPCRILPCSPSNGTEKGCLFGWCFGEDWACRLDAIRRHVRTDFGRINPKWCISVSQI